MTLNFKKKIHTLNEKKLRHVINFLKNFIGIGPKLIIRLIMKNDFLKLKSFINIMQFVHKHLRVNFHPIKFIFLSTKY
jgi:hypothetical protein